MVWGALVLMWGVRIGTLYKLQGSTIIDGCNSSVVPESGAENLVVFGEKTMLWHQRLGHIGEKGLRILHGKGMVEGMSNSSLDFDFFENCEFPNCSKNYVAIQLGRCKFIFRFDTGIRKRRARMRITESSNEFTDFENFEVEGSRAQKRLPPCKRSITPGSVLL